jgi:hypothetical protein
MPGRSDFYLKQCKTLHDHVSKTAYSLTSFKTISDIIVSYNPDAKCRWDLDTPDGKRFYTLLPYIIELAIVELKTSTQNRNGSYVDLIGIISCSILAIPVLPYNFLPIILDATTIGQTLTLFDDMRTTSVNNRNLIQDLYPNTASYDNFSDIYQLLLAEGSAVSTKNHQPPSVITIEDIQIANTWLQLLLDDTGFRVFSRRNDGIMYLNSKWVESTQLYITALAVDIANTKKATSVHIRSNNLLLISMIHFICAVFEIDCVMDNKLMDHPTTFWIMRTKPAVKSLFRYMLKGRFRYPKSLFVNAPHWHYLHSHDFIWLENADIFKPCDFCELSTNTRLAYPCGHNICGDELHNPEKWGNASAFAESPTIHYKIKCPACRNRIPVSYNRTTMQDTKEVPVKRWFGSHSMHIKNVSGLHLYVLEFACNKVLPCHFMNLPFTISQTGTTQIYLNCTFETFNFLVTNHSILTPVGHSFISLYSLINQLYYKQLLDMKTEVSVGLYIYQNSVVVQETQTI